MVSHPSGSSLSSVGESNGAGSLVGDDVGRKIWGESHRGQLGWKAQGESMAPGLSGTLSQLQIFIYKFIDRQSHQNT